MGKNPNAIFRELYRTAKHKAGIVDSVGGTNTPYEMGKQDGCYYVTYQQVIKSFMIEGYSVQRAIRHIDQWIDYDILFVRYNDGTKFIGFNQDVIR